MKRILFCVIALFAIASNASAYDFSAIAPSGQTLYYNIVDGNAEVTSQNSSSPYYTIYPTGNLIIPETVSYNGTTFFVSSIGNYAFYGCTGLTALTIPNSIMSIGIAFNECYGLTAVYYTGNVADWCEISFAGLYSNPLLYAQNLYIDNTLVSDLIIPDSVTHIKNYAFYCCKSLHSLTIGNAVTSIGSWAFYDCYQHTGSLIIPSSVSTIGEYAFNCCRGLTGDLTIPYTVTEIHDYAFSGCTGLSSVSLQGSLSTFGMCAFGSCTGLTSLNFSDSITYIGHSAFSTCISLASLTIPKNVTSIGPGAFQNCTGLAEIYSSNPIPPTVGFYAFYGISTTIPVHIPCGSLDSYTTASHWSNFSNYIVEEYEFEFNVTSANFSMGSVQILDTPDCINYHAMVSASANSGYQFDHWSDGSIENPYSLIVTEDMSLTAYFSPAQTYYTITVSANDAEMGTVTGGGSFAEGSTTTITATANSGYHFVQWQDGNTEASRSITVTADAEYTAYFAANGANDYTITVMAQNPSMGSTTGSGTFAYGTVTTITAEPYEGYYFVQWNDGNTQRIRTITVTGNATYTAYFEPNAGIDDIAADQIKIYSRGSEIVIEGADNTDALVYDIMGRIVHKGRIESPIHVNNMGVYMVKIGNRQPQKVVVR